MMISLRAAARDEDKGERQRALQALRYAKKRLEGLVDWQFDISRIDRKDVMAFAHREVAKFFSKA
ncbi:MAG: hypothetical protein IAG10_34195 [Planctomycetaceae bacterium]|nr:hypothetical protein [Planctomycetaceae bacterium]